MFIKHKHTSLVIPGAVSNRLYLDDPNPDGGGGEPAGDPAPADSGSSFQMPDKFKGKSAEEIAQIHTNLEREYTKLKQGGGTSKELSELRGYIDNKFNELRSSREPANPDEQAARQQQVEIAKSLGLAFKSDVDEAFERGKREAATALTVSELEKKYAGKDGSPRFASEDMYNWLQTAPEWLKQAPLETAFQHRFSKEFRDLEIKKALQGNRAPSVPKGGPRQAPTTPDISKMTPEQRREHVKAGLEGGAYDN